MAGGQTGGWGLVWCLLARGVKDGGCTGEVVAADVVGLGVLDEGPDLGLLEVLDVVVVGGAELGAHAAVVARDDDAAAARLLLGVDAVLDAQADLLDGVVQDGGVLIVANAAEVDDAVGREHVLGAAGRVLGRAAGDQLGVVVVEQVLEDALVLLLGEDGVVGLEAVLGEERIVADSLDVWEGERLAVGFGHRTVKQRVDMVSEALVAGASPSPLSGTTTGERGVVRAINWQLLEFNTRDIGRIHTEERVLQAEESVILGGGHFARDCPDTGSWDGGVLVLYSEELRGAGHPSPAGGGGRGRGGMAVIGSTPTKSADMTPKGGLGQGLHTREEYSGAKHCSSSTVVLTIFQIGIKFMNRRGSGLKEQA